MCDLRPRICLNYDHFERRPMVTLTRDDFEKLYISRAAYDELNAKVAALQAELIRAIDIYKDPAVAHANILNGRIVLPKFYVNITDDFGPVAGLRAALDAAINMNIEKNAEVVRLTAALREANEDGLDIATLEYAAKWIENSLAGETSDRVIEFGKSMAMSIRAAKPLVKICAECGGSGEVAGDYFSDDGMSTCARCNGVGHERI